MDGITSVMVGWLDDTSGIIDAWGWHIWYYSWIVGWHGIMFGWLDGITGIVV